MPARCNSNFLGFEYEKSYDALAEWLAYSGFLDRLRGWWRRQERQRFIQHNGKIID
jgi:hypothetical protein